MASPRPGLPSIDIGTIDSNATAAIAGNNNTTFINTANAGTVVTSGEYVLDNGSSIHFTADGKIFSNGPNAISLSENTGSVSIIANGGGTVNIEEALGAQTAIFANDTNISLNSVFNQDGIYAQVSRLYLGLFGRYPDQPGLENWVNSAVNNGFSLLDIANSFTASPEFQALNVADNREYVTNLYQQILGRNPDIDGLNNWVNRIDSGIETRAQTLLNFTESIEGKALFAPAIDSIIGSQTGINGHTAINAINGSHNIITTNNGDQITLHHTELPLNEDGSLAPYSSKVYAFDGHDVITVQGPAIADLYGGFGNDTYHIGNGAKVSITDIHGLNDIILDSSTFDGTNQTVTIGGASVVFLNNGADADITLDLSTFSSLDGIEHLPAGAQPIRDTEVIRFSEGSTINLTNIQDAIDRGVIEDSVHVVHFNNAGEFNNSVAINFQPEVGDGYDLIFHQTTDAASQKIIGDLGLAYVASVDGSVTQYTVSAYELGRENAPLVGIGAAPAYDYAA